MKTAEEIPDPFGTHDARNFPEDYSQENGNYINTCRDCGLSFRGNKHRIWCRMCEEPNWEELANIQRPERVDPIPGAWLQGEMVGFARCMVKKVKPLLAVSEEKDRRIRELSDELVKCEKTFGLIWQIFGTLENAHCDDLRHLVDNIDIDLPLIQARIKDTLNPPKP